VTAIEVAKARYPEIPPEMLASPTLGAWRREHGVTGWCDEAKVLFAVHLVQEARRRVLLDRLEGVYNNLAVGGNPDHAIDRLNKLVPQ
jgi:hypothetical protein